MRLSSWYSGIPALQGRVDVNQIAPYELPEEVAAFPSGSLELLPRELELHNTFGESL
jgi:hypothetical protein